MSLTIALQTGPAPRMRIENWELRIGQIEFVGQLLRLRAIALALRVPILNSHPSGDLSLW